MSVGSIPMSCTAGGKVSAYLYSPWGIDKLRIAACSIYVKRCWSLKFSNSSTIKNLMSGFFLITLLLWSTLDFLELEPGGKVFVFIPFKHAFLHMYRSINTLVAIHSLKFWWSSLSLSPSCIIFLIQKQGKMRQVTRMPCHISLQTTKDMDLMSSNDAISSTGSWQWFWCLDFNISIM